MGPWSNGMIRPWLGCGSSSILDGSILKGKDYKYYTLIMKMAKRKKGAEASEVKVNNRLLEIEDSGEPSIDDLKAIRRYIG